MSFGLKVWDGDGNVVLDENSFTMRVVYSGLVTGGSTASSQTISIPGVTTSNASAFVVPIGAYGTFDKQLETEVISGGARVYNYNRSRPEYSAITQVTMRLIVIRFS